MATSNDVPRGLEARFKTTDTSLILASESGVMNWAAFQFVALAVTEPVGVLPVMLSKMTSVEE